MTLVYLAIAWGCGIWLSHLLRAQGVLGCATPGWAFGLVSAAAIGAAIVLRRNRTARLGAALIACAVFGGWRYHVQPLAPCITPANLAYYHQDAAAHATVEGVVVAYPELRDAQTYYQLKAESVTIGGETHPVTGRALVRGPRFPNYKYGDRLAATGLLTTPPVLDDFDYRAYLAQDGIHSLMNRAQVEQVGRGEGNRLIALLYRTREQGAAVLDRALPEPAAALASGILLGIEGGIPRDLYDVFNATATSHIIVISGSNIALLTGLIMAALTQLFGKRRAVLPTVAVIGLYVLLVGGEPSALRAGLMGALFVLAIYLGRRSTAYVSLCAAGMVMTLLNPLALWNLGFQLSFLATLGLIVFSRPIQGRMDAWLQGKTINDDVRRGLRLFVGVAAMTLAAQITTLPLLVSTFGRLSLISFIANLLIVPVQPIVMTGGLATLLGGLLCEPLGRVLAVIPWLFLTYTTTIVRLAAAIPFAAIDVGEAGRALATLYYAALIAAMLWREAHSRRWVDVPVGRAGALIAAVALPVWLAASWLAALPDGRLHVAYAPGKDSEAVLIVTPSGQSVWLWDGGEDGEGLARTTRALLAGRRTVDVVVGENAAALWPGAEAISNAQLASGAALRLEDGVELTRLACRETPVLLLTYRDFRVLLPPTLSPEEQECLLSEHGADELRVTVLKTPLSGTGAWPLAGFIAATSPQLVLWPEETTYPPDTDEALRQHGAIRVPSGAAVEIITDGTQLWVQQRSIER